jgi:hypothetical protein
MTIENHRIVKNGRVQCDLWSAQEESICVSPRGGCKACWLQNALNYFVMNAREELWQKAEDDRVTLEVCYEPLFELIEEISPGSKHLLEWRRASPDCVRLACSHIRHDLRKGAPHA